MIKKYWLNHPNLRPWTRAFLSLLKDHDGWFIATLLYPQSVGSDADPMGEALFTEHFVARSEEEAMNLLRSWVREKFGDGLREKLMRDDEADWR